MENVESGAFGGLVGGSPARPSVLRSESHRGGHNRHHCEAHLRQFADSEGLATDDDAACRLWATRVDGVEHAPRLDTIVGSVKGIGPALFAYMRMRSGADALKVDVRVKKNLKLLGFTVPADDHAVMIVVNAVAEEVDLPVLALDQLLWHME